MPELPEAEAARCLLEAQIKGKVITEIIAVEAGGGPRSGQFDEIVFDDTASAASVGKALLKRRVASVHRRGKQLCVRLSLLPAVRLHFSVTSA